MTSLLTNGGAIAALDTLRNIDRSMSKTQDQIATGLRVGKSSDNAAYWSIATTMKSDDRAMAAVKDALALGAATIDTAYIGMTSAIDVMDEYKAKLVAAREPGVDRNKVNAELTELRAQMRTIAESSSFNGQNWLVTEDGANEAARSLVTSFIRNDDNTVRVGSQTYDSTNGSLGEPNRLIDETGTSGAMYGILTQPAVAVGIDTTPPLYYVFLKGEDPWTLAEEMTVSDATTTEEFDQMISYADFMHRNMTSAAARLGALADHFDRQSEFVQDLRDVASKGVGRLRDADMNEQSARLKALQTQEQLGLQALSIANSNSESIVSLFR